MPRGFECRTSALPCACALLAAPAVAATVTAAATRSRREGSSVAGDEDVMVWFLRWRFHLRKLPGPQAYHGSSLKRVTRVHSPSSSAFTRDFDALWTGVNAL